MKRFFRDLWYRGQYAVILGLDWLVRHLPLRVLWLLARGIGWMLDHIPPFRKLVRSNIHAAMPELPPEEVARIGRESCFNLIFNMLEFFWLSGDPERIRRRYRPPEELLAHLREHLEKGERIIFVNPHLGSWEASGVMAPFYAGIRMVAIAKPMRNPYFNRFINYRNREKVAGMEIVLSRGAIRASLKALHDGKSLGTLIDQNTRVRDGGVFVDFFGIPVASSAAPAALKRYCDGKGIPAVIIYATSIRQGMGQTTVYNEYLSRPFSEYADDRAVLQELMQISERYIRRFPEQYLWFYHRFQNIPRDASPEVRARYPWYAKEVRPTFYRKTASESAK